MAGERACGRSDVVIWVGRGGGYSCCRVPYFFLVAEFMSFVRDSSRVLGMMAMHILQRREDLSTSVIADGQPIVILFMLVDCAGKNGVKHTHRRDR